MPLSRLNQMRNGWNEECFAILMRLFGITKPGLMAMTISVMALWTCIALEKSAIHRGDMDARSRARALEELRQRPVPASAPIPFHRQLPKMS